VTRAFAADPSFYSCLWGGFSLFFELWSGGWSDAEREYASDKCAVIFRLWPFARLIGAGVEGRFAAMAG
jgi:hypothetical protein